DHRRALRLVLQEGALLVMVGLLIGAPGIYIVKAMIRGLLVGVSPYDPVALLTAALGLLLVAMTACYVPARRALRIEPSQLLHQEGMRESAAKWSRAGRSASWTSRCPPGLGRHECRLHESIDHEERSNSPLICRSAKLPWRLRLRPWRRRRPSIN